MVASALMGISGLDEDGHEVKNVIKSSFGLDLKPFLKIFNKDSIFKFLFFGPVTFFFIDNQLFIRLSMYKERVDRCLS